MLYKTYPFRVQIFSGPGPVFIHFWVRVQVLILSSKSRSVSGSDFIHFETGCGFYQACPIPVPRPDFKNTRNFRSYLGGLPKNKVL